jgi:hypothetical protein
MAGVKGRSGGPRPNSGGARPGAGRKPTVPRAVTSTYYADAEQYLVAIVEGREPPDQLRIAAAKTLIAYQRARQRAPVPTPPPQQLAKRAAHGAEAERNAEWEKRATEIRARHGRKT